MIVCILATSVAFATSWEWPQHRWWLFASDGGFTQVALHSHAGALAIQTANSASWLYFPVSPSAWMIEYENGNGELRLSIPYWFLLGLLLTMAFLTWWRGRIRRARWIGKGIQQ